MKQRAIAGGVAVLIAISGGMYLHQTGATVAPHQLKAPPRHLNTDAVRGDVARAIRKSPPVATRGGQGFEPAHPTATGRSGDVKTFDREVRRGEEEGVETERDQEPVDPAEFRPQQMPPPRPELGAPGAPADAGLVWISRGPGPTQSAQVTVPPDNEVCGAIQAIAPHPTDASILYIGAVNGGVWKTTNATAARPTWTPLTDAMPSLSIGSLVLDPTDATSQTLVAGTGRMSNFAQRGDDEVGVYRTTDGGTSWTQLGASTLLGHKLVAVAARSATLLAGSASGGLFRSTNTGANWSLVSGTGGLPTGGIYDLVGDRSSNSRLYVATTGRKVLRSDDTGATWTDVTTGITGLSASTTNMKVSVGASGVLYLAVVNTGVLAGVWRSPNQGALWTAMDVPAIHPGSQGFPNTSIAADPVDANRVYLGGDRITASPFTANVVTGDFSLSAGSQFSSRVDGNAGSTTPHADSRALAFDANGALLESSDGGIYRRSSPTSTSGTWASVIGNLNVLEVHDLAYDGVAGLMMIGTQDNGTHMQQAASDTRWVSINGGDGGDVAVDDTSLAPNFSFRFLSSQNLGGFARRKYSSLNVRQTPSVSAGTISDPQFVTPIELSATDRSRLLVGGVSTIYESTNANGAAISLTSLGGPGANRNAMTYGTTGDAGFAYVGSGSAVFKRSGNTFVTTATLPTGRATVTDVTMNPADPQTVFAVDDNQVFRSTDGGASWTDVTGNLPSIASQDFRTIEYLPLSTGDLVAIGTRSGVYSAPVASSSWSLLGTALPDVLVFDMRYVAATKTLIAGTLGRGVWSLSLGTVTVPGAPTIGTVTGGNGSVSVAFTAPSNDGGSAIIGYAATCGTKSASGTGSPITVSGLTNGTPVTCTVVATNAIGTGAASAASNSVTPATVPGAPTIGTATAFNRSATVTFTAPASNGGSAITGYTATCGSQSKSEAVSPITVTGLSNGTAVTCTVVATNIVGNGAPSAASNSVIPFDTTLSIGDASASEGNAGSTTFNFTVTLSASVSYTVTVGYATQDGTAAAGSDYTATSGTLTFSPGQTSKTIAVSVTGDPVAESNEAFGVVLSGPVLATLSRPIGLGTIKDDDRTPTSAAPSRPQAAWHEFFAVDTLETPYIGDFDGDRKADIITFTRQNPTAIGDVYVALSDGAKFGANTKWQDFFAITTDESVVIGDYNGDEKDDIATWLGKASRQIYVALSTGSGMLAEAVWVDSIGKDPTDLIFAGDTNGDGKDDLVDFARKEGKVYVALSDGTKFGTPTQWHGFFAVSTFERPRVADVNGDGKADIVTFSTDSPTAFGDVYVATSDGTKFVGATGAANDSSKWHDFFAIRPTEEIRIGDLNGDGKDDFFTFLPPPFAQCYSVLSQGTSMAENALWAEAVAPLLGEGDNVYVADVNGDGKADIIIFAQKEGKVYVSLAPL